MTEYTQTLSLTIGDATYVVTFPGIAPGAQTGSAMTQGNFNGDGKSDFIVAAPGIGKVYAVFGTAAPPAVFPLASLNGANGTTLFGNANVAVVPTLSSEGLTELLGDIVFNSTPNAVKVVNGQSSPPATIDWDSAINVTDVALDPAVSILEVFENGSKVGVAGVTTTSVVIGNLTPVALIDDTAISNSPLLIETLLPPLNHVLSVGDFNGDDSPDLIITDLFQKPAGQDRDAFLIYGTLSGFPNTIDLSNLNGGNGFLIHGASGQNLGGSVTSVGDFNQDGLDDIVVAAGGPNPNVHLIFGTNTNFGAAGFDVTAFNGSNGFSIIPEVAGDLVDASLDAAGDVNGDGFADLIIGAPNANGGAGGAYVFFGRAGGFAATFNLSALDGNNGFKIVGEAAGDHAGKVVDPGDFNGDGFSDVGIGAPDASPNGAQSGAAYLVFGGKPAEPVTRTGTNIGQTIRGGDFNDHIFGLGGDDTLKGYGGQDELDGGMGSDTADYSDKTVDVVVTLNGGTDTTVMVASNPEDTIRNIENLIGGSVADTLTGDSLDNVFRGGPGVDTLDGAGGLDTADYGDKISKVSVVLDGANPVVVAVGNVAEDLISNIENITGGSAGDFLDGDGLANVLAGGKGNDSLFGEGGNDTLLGGEGDDDLQGGAGSDILDGGPGTDVADYSYIFGSIAVVLTLNGANDSIATVGGVAEDTVRNIENIIGGPGNDTLTGDGLANVFQPGSGDDIVDGAGGLDTIDYSGRSAAEPIIVTLNGANNATVNVAGVDEDTIRNIENVIGAAAPIRLPATIWTTCSKAVLATIASMAAAVMTPPCSLP
jgi:hypothetical protein